MSSPSLAGSRFPDHSKLVFRNHSFLQRRCTKPLPTTTSGEPAKNLSSLLFRQVPTTTKLFCCPCLSKGINYLSLLSNTTTPPTHAKQRMILSLLICMYYNFLKPCISYKSIGRYDREKAGVWHGAVRGVFDRAAAKYIVHLKILVQPILFNSSVLVLARKARLPNSSL